MENNYLLGAEVKADLKSGIEHGKSVYFQRMCGLTEAWSATTRCVMCGDYWLVGVRQNLDFTCSTCLQNGNGEKK